MWLNAIQPSIRKDSLTSTRQRAGWLAKPPCETGKRLAEMLKERTEIPIILWDERLTTVSAHSLMNETNVRGQKRKDSVDSISAAYILQGYLDSLKL